MSLELPQFSERRRFAHERLTELKHKLTELSRFENLCVYATGSYAREEASEHSDIDLFFIHDGSQQTSQFSRLDQLRLFARVIEIGQEMNFPTFSNDGQFLEILYVDELLEMLGGREDDYHNFFTARMLLLLESAPLINDSLYTQVLNKVVGSYFRDYPNHAKDFRPVFLINDILRFWKTLCLNYEHRRNKPEHDEVKKHKQSVKNFKLKFSRLMSCFGTVAAICAEKSPIDQDFVVQLSERIPLDRFYLALEKLNDLHSLRSEILDDYAWFMEKTALSTEDLTVLFESKEEKIRMFQRADDFGLKVYKALAHCAESNGYSRYLVI